MVATPQQMAWLHSLSRRNELMMIRKYPEHRADVEFLSEQLFSKVPVAELAKGQPVTSAPSSSSGGKISRSCAEEFLAQSCAVEEAEVNWDDGAVLEQQSRRYSAGSSDSERHAGSASLGHGRADHRRRSSANSHSRRSSASSRSRSRSRSSSRSRSRSASGDLKPEEPGTPHTMPHTMPPPAVLLLLRRRWQPLWRRRRSNAAAVEQATTMLARQREWRWRSGGCQLCSTLELQALAAAFWLHCRPLETTDGWGVLRAARRFRVSGWTRATRHSSRHFH